MSMEDWAKRLDGFLEFNGNELLIGPGKISAEQAKLHVETEYEKYRITQDRLYESDFDRFLLLEREINDEDRGQSLRIFRDCFVANYIYIIATISLKVSISDFITYLKKNSFIRIGI